MVFATVGCAAVSILLMAVCFIAGICPCEKTEEAKPEPAIPFHPADHVDLGWMRAA
jgi:hypothetical protein